ncbi:MAG TPA: hypothetical protein VH396_15460 [Chitinophagaceae bacterium]|jgi:hypothetical protein
MNCMFVASIHLQTQNYFATNALTSKNIPWTNLNRYAGEMRRFAKIKTKEVQLPGTITGRFEEQKIWLPNHSIKFFWGAHVFPLMIL